MRVDHRSVDLSARLHRGMKSLQTIVLLSGLAISVLTGLFPPWASVIAGNAYPPVPYHWMFSAAPVVNGQVCRVDEVRLAMRIGIVLSSTGILFLAAGLLKVDKRCDNVD